MLRKNYTVDAIFLLLMFIVVMEEYFEPSFRNILLLWLLPLWVLILDKTLDAVITVVIAFFKSRRKK